MSDLSVGCLKGSQAPFLLVSFTSLHILPELGFCNQQVSKGGNVLPASVLLGCTQVTGIPQLGGSQKPL